MCGVPQAPSRRSAAPSPLSPQAPAGAAWMKTMNKEAFVAMLIWRMIGWVGAWRAWCVFFGRRKVADEMGEEWWWCLWVEKVVGVGRMGVEGRCW